MKLAWNNEAFNTKDTFVEDSLCANVVENMTHTSSQVMSQLFESVESGKMNMVS